MVKGSQRLLHRQVQTSRIMARNKERGEQVAKEYEQYGVRGIFIKGDVTNPEDCARVADKVAEMFGKIDILVNNAGTGWHIKCEEMDFEADWRQVMKVNLDGVFLMMKAVGKKMIEQKFGSIINVSSISADVVNWPQPQCAYNSSKGGVNMLTKCIAYEWAQHNIRVNAIAPGYVATELLPDGALETEKGQKWLMHTPMNRVGKPEEMGGIAVYLASDASSYATGGIFTVDGGYSLI